MQSPRFALALALLALALPSAAIPQATPPNVVWLTVEDMSPWIPCYGDNTVATPHLDRLATSSVRYTRAFASSPVCAPARSSLITGCYATRIGTMHMRTGNPSRAALDRDPSAYANIPSYEGVPPTDVRCFPELLRASGYYCTNAAKTDYQFQAPATVWDASSGKAHWKNRAPDQPFFAVFNHGGTHESRAFPKTKWKRVVAPEDVVVPPIYPDTPAVREALSRTYGNIAAMDAWVGKKLDELEAAGLLETTWVFFFSDHGVGLPRGKRSPYDLGTRVPLLVRPPGGRATDPSGPASLENDERVVSFVDFGPTVLSLAGIEPPKSCDGRAFLGKHVRPSNGHAFAHADRFDSVYDSARSVSDGRFRYVRNYATDVPHLIPNAYRENLTMMADLLALRGTELDKPSVWQCASTKRPREELYDSAKDPWEVHNLAGEDEHEATLERLRQVLDTWITDTGDLGLVLPEEHMVAKHLWPKLRQPKTAPATMHREAGQVHLEPTTPGTSIGYRTQAGEAWTVYVKPFDPGKDTTLEVLSHRIGFIPTQQSYELP